MRESFFLGSGSTLAATPVDPQSDSDSCSEPSDAFLLLLLGEDVVYEDSVVSSVCLHVMLLYAGCVFVPLTLSVR